MAKISGTYQSLARGVSQQPFEARLAGQHGEQVNMWSDPVHGLSRRRGTTLQACVATNVTGPSYYELPEYKRAELDEFYASYRTTPFVVEGQELQVHYPTKVQPSWFQSFPTGPQGGIRVTRKLQNPSVNQPGAEIVPLSAGIPGDAQHTATLADIAKGVTAACQVGRFILLACNATKFTVPPEVDAWAALSNGHISIQIKNGIPNRQYSVTALVDGVPTTWSYTTPSSSYTGTLTTSDIAFSDPEYQKKVNDRVNAYNSAVTAWLSTAANLTKPQYIADSLQIAISGALAAVGVTVSGFLNSAGVLLQVTNGRVTGCTATDSGDDSSVVVAERTVTSLDKLTAAHTEGKIIQVKPGKGEAAFYVKAVPVSGTNGFRGVRWEECPRTTSGAISNPFLVIAIKEPATPGTPTVGISKATTAGLAYLASAAILNDSSVLTLPQFGSRSVGDTDTSPAPGFFNKQITWMGTFQDRLCLAAGNTIDMSEVGNYFNFFRTQTLTVPDTDPVNVYALGSEADTIRHSVIFDRSLLLFGDNQQYSIDGRNPITPSTSTVIQSSAVEGATDCPPVAAGSLVFFGKRREGSTEVFQMEVGNVADTSNITALGIQLADYLPGSPVQLLYVPSPSTLIVRCSGAPRSVFVFRFIDQNRQRIMDSWSRFDYPEQFGAICGMFYHDDALYYRVARDAWKDQDGAVWTGWGGRYGFDVLERQSMLPQVPGVPYLDSVRPVELTYDPVNFQQDFWGKSYPFMATAFTRDKINNRGPLDPVPPKFAYWLHGAQPNTKSAADWNTAFADIPTRDVNYCVTGMPFDSYVDLTSPVRRDQNDQPLMQGRLTVNKLDVHYKDSGGFSATVTSNYGIAAQYNGFDWVATDTAWGKVTALRFNGRVLGQAANMVGIVPVATGTTAVFVGRESKEYVCRISSRSWMPLSITRITWTGQWFLNHRFI